MHLQHVCDLVKPTDVTRPWHGSLADTHDMTSKPTWLMREGRICNAGGS